jgi:hypothetical protein
MTQAKSFFTPLRVVIAALLVMAVALPLATPAQAGTGIEGDPDAIVREGVTIDDDLFITGRLVQIDGTVLGDVFAAGQEVVVNGDIEGNLFVGSQTIVVDGTVNGTVFAGAQLITVGGQIADNLVAGSYSTELTEEAGVGGSIYFGGFNLSTGEATQIGRSIYAGAYQLDLDGQVARDVTASLGAFQLNGSVGRNVLLELNETREGSSVDPNDFTYYVPGNIIVLPEGIAQGPDAVIAGTFDYSINRYRAPQLPSGQEIGDDLAGAIVGNWARTRVAEFMALLILGALLFYLVPKPADEAVEEMRQRPLANLGWGLLVAILTPLAFLISLLLLIALAVVLGFVTLGGLVGTILSIGGFGLALLWAAFGLLFWMVSKIIFAYLIGHSLFARINPETLEGRWAALIVLLVGLLLYELVRAIPLLGGLLALFVILIGVGAIYQVLRTRWLASRQPA